MKNTNLEKMIDSLMELTCDRENSKTTRLWAKDITIAFDGLSCEIPFNALNYITILNALCHISQANEIHGFNVNETMFDILALEQLCFNLEESLNFDNTAEELKATAEELVNAKIEKYTTYEKLRSLTKSTLKDFYSLKQELKKII